MAQWKEQFRKGFQDDDRLIIATASPSADIRTVATALERRRDPLAGELSNRESQVLTRLTLQLGGLNDQDRAHLLDRAAILILDVDDPGASDLGLAAEMLDRSVVESGEGRGAVRLLRDRLRDAAVLRSGVSERSWSITSLNRGTTSVPYQ